MCWKSTADLGDNDDVHPRIRLGDTAGHGIRHRMARSGKSRRFIRLRSRHLTCHSSDNCGRSVTVALPPPDLTPVTEWRSPPLFRNCVGEILSTRIRNTSNALFSHALALNKSPGSLNAARATPYRRCQMSCSICDCSRPDECASGPADVAGLPEAIAMREKGIG